MTEEERTKTVADKFADSRSELKRISSSFHNPNLTHAERTSLISEYGNAWKTFESARAAMLRKENK